jgi:hypothetical protein
VDGEAFYVVALRETGTLKEIPGPCPKTVQTPSQWRLYKLQYRLSTPQEPAQVSPLDLTTDDPMIKSKLTGGENFDWVQRALDVPRTASLYCDLRPKINCVGEGALANEDAKVLNRLGFETGRQVYYTDRAEGRWYLGFDPFAAGVQVCCPKERIVFQTQLKANGATIWDPDRARLLLIADESHQCIIGLPKSVTVWDYRKDRLTSFDLPLVSEEELR